jgi:2-methylcitrate dehydratase PrpD
MGVVSSILCRPPWLDVLPDPLLHVGERYRRSTPDRKFACLVDDLERPARPAQLKADALASPQLAALAIGVAAHIMDYDMSSLLGQPTSPIIPALLPLAESIGATPDEAMAAFIVGFEVCLKLALAAPEQSNIGGRHVVGSIGTMGAAMACARLLRAPRETIPDILGIAASLSGGLAANFGTMTKPLHSGTSARNGILAATLGRNGFTANAATLEHPAAGYFRAFTRGTKVSFEPFM